MRYINGKWGTCRVCDELRSNMIKNGVNISSRNIYHFKRSLENEWRGTRHWIDKGCVRDKIKTHNPWDKSSVVMGFDLISDIMLYNPICPCTHYPRTFFKWYIFIKHTLFLFVIMFHLSSSLSLLVLIFQLTYLVVMVKC
jgi:hypothetical protein